MSERADMSLRIASWNIHSGIGQDGRYDPQRIAKLIDRMDLDIVGLQEVSLSGIHADEALLNTLAPQFAYWHFVPTHVQYPHYRGGRAAGFGNLLLSRWPLCIHNTLDLSFMRREPRNKLVCEVATPIGTLWVWVTHFGLRYAERRRQARRVAQAVQTLGPQEPLVLLGDFNDWMPGSPSLLALRSALGRPAARRTFPARWPLLALDQLWLRGPLWLEDLVAVRAQDVRQASDHLPLRAEVRMQNIFALE